MNWEQDNEIKFQDENNCLILVFGDKNWNSLPFRFDSIRFIFVLFRFVLFFVSWEFDIVNGRVWFEFARKKNWARLDKYLVIEMKKCALSAIQNMHQHACRMSHAYLKVLVNSLVSFLSYFFFFLKKKSFHAIHFLSDCDKNISLEWT